jgi:acyl carrier protein
MPADVCTFAIDDAIYGQTVGIAIVLNKRDDETVRALHKWMTVHLAEHKLPSRWWIVDEIPRTSRGKINRDAVNAACMRPRQALELSRKSWPGERRRVERGKAAATAGADRIPAQHPETEQADRARLVSDENLVTSGLIDSLALVEIVVYLENTYGIDFSTPRLRTGTSFVDDQQFLISLSKRAH